jgi:hypothetical protein
MAEGHSNARKKLPDLAAVNARVIMGLFLQEARMDFLFELPVSNGVLPVTPALPNTEPAPSTTGTVIKDPPPPPRLDVDDTTSVLGSDVKDPPQPPK